MADEIKNVEGEAAVQGNCRAFRRNLQSSYG